MRGDDTMLVLIYSQLSNSKRASCPVNACALECTRYWRKSKRARRPAKDCGSVCANLVCGLNL